jgi:hypothetical protein
VLLTIFLSLKVSAQEKSIWEEFSFKPYASVGLGFQPMTVHGSKYYGNVKFFPLHYGPEDIGVSFLGLGYSFSDNISGGSFSPMGLRAKNTVVSMDIHSNRSDSVGISLSYYWPLNFP